MSRPITKFLAWSHYSFFVAGLAALGYCAVVVGTTGYYQARAREQLRESMLELPSGYAATNGRWHSVRPPLRVGSGFALVGRVEAPRVGLSAMIGEGATSRVLRVAVGHVPGTAFPWEPGNVVLAAHRDTFFRRVGELRSGDIIQITVPGGEYRYRVTFTDIVNPDENWVLQPAAGAMLTLITCYPFHFVGAAPKRFVVRAHKIDGE